MEILTLARIQFAMTTVFHFLFVPLSIGLGLAVAIMETLYVIKKDEVYKDMTKFWGKIFLLSFAVGVVTGIIQEFQFGMNWSEYSRFMGDIFGAPLAVEALLAFFLESTFIGLWAFTWDKVPKKVHALFMWLVAIGSALSALWILAANSFMQHPVGFTINPETNRAEMTSFFELLKNSQLWLEFPHVLFGAFVTGAFVIAGLAAFNLARKRDIEFNRKSLKFGLIMGLISSIVVILVGHRQVNDLIREQPMKFAAMEALYEDTVDENVPWKLIAFPDTDKKEEGFSIEIPYMLSILGSDHEGSFKGMKTVDAEFQEEFKEQIADYKEKYGEDMNFYVPVKTLFWSFRFMAGFGTLFVFIAMVGLFLLRDNKLLEMKWLLQIIGLMTFLPFVANTCGWLITELGRFPWTVYGLFTIADSVSPSVTAGELLTSNIIYFLLFSFIGAVLVHFIHREHKRGPYYQPEVVNTSQDPLAKEAF
ncbi:cytochrome ubiquinol oxidase subunit I [Vagococcus lutrae]|uniref:Cytochrome ubiquinol oxidase subunit I n=1 Tax=Vagococcus lutrae TaxID=81947 RepID=A0AAF0BI31_9ENTE|nr:cytochrome ubiquinol oxidase subunit I [Vagococcus lutrae]MCO7151864.1 cytochrome ubiquinol oxidase subunit I [Vagococcus lutrae]MDT2801439.1 cytochrome ubiquinol oxidase subunit I [Vagococcus lutrae]MDT2806417.1 cytochrome ubiquinol oxidase subunit I [Vagococcus lutrae]MDT2813098.1 cytochrome ubiquinol oxidase subunit I [Vagococcus lutrae]MDT2817866.1 cytochrome ubiquinol oxidase subunit I [Vagococcus lutrae]